MSKKLLVVACAAAFALALVLAGCSQSSSGGEEDASADAAAQQKTYTIQRVVNGTPDWGSVPQVDIDIAPWTDSYGISAHAQLCYDDNTLYVHMSAVESDIRAEHPRDELMPSAYEDSCLEFFFSPVEGDARYLNFEINPNCALAAQVGIQKTDRTWIIPDEDVYNATSDRTDDGWEVYYDLPFSYIQSVFPDFAPESGTEMRGNFYKCGNLTAHKHYLTWNPIESDKPNFHVPACFGNLVFE